MKKKIIFSGILSLCFVFCLLTFSGCKSAVENIVKNNMAELTESYFWGQTDDFELSLSIGRREEPYVIDGYARKTLPYSLFVLQDKTDSERLDQVECQLEIDKKTQKICLQYNPVADRYMFDLGVTIEKNATVNLSFNGQKCSLKCISNDFLSSADAIKIACKAFEKEILACKSDGRLKAECYLKIMGNEGRHFWCFTLMCQDQTSHNLIIDVTDGKIVAID